MLLLKKFRMDMYMVWVGISIDVLVTGVLVIGVLVISVLVTGITKKKGLNIKCSDLFSFRANAPK